MFLAAVALPCLVLYHRAVVAPGDLLVAASIPWRRGAARDWSVELGDYFDLMESSNRT